MSQPLRKLKQSSRACEACHNDSVNLLLDGLAHEYRRGGKTEVWQYSLLECRLCGLGFVDPKPTWEVLQTFYEESYGCFDGSSPATLYKPNSLKFKIARMRGAFIRPDGLPAVLRTALGGLTEWLTGKTIPFTLSIPLQLPSDAHIFDLGYGSGNWLLALSEIGYRNLHGYDIGANALNAARLKNRGVKISSGSFLENQYPRSLFDCIRLDHVFEHLKDPIEVLKKCHRMLKPGGFLLMTFPCKNSWAFSLSITDSPALQVPKHLFHHTQRSARLMLESGGFAPLKIVAYSVSSQLGGTINSVLRKKNRRTIPPLLFEMLSPLYRLFSKLTGKGDFLTVWATRHNVVSTINESCE